MTDLQPDYFERPLAEVDPEVAEAIGREIQRQQRTLEMIASENFVPQAVLECQGSVLTNKYAEGYPGKRYYGGCECVDVIEQLAIDRAKALFGAEHANVQPHAGAQANTAVYHALLQPGDRIMGLEPPARRPPQPRDEDQRLRPAVRHRALRGQRRTTTGSTWTRSSAWPRSTGRSCCSPAGRAYPRFLDFERFREIADEVGALLMVDMAHFAGLVAAGRAPEPGPVRRRRHHHHPQDARRPALRHDPVPGGVREEDQLGGLPRPAGRPAGARHRRQGRGVQDRRSPSCSASASGARSPAPRRVAEELLSAGHGVSVLTGGTDVHLVLVDLRESELDGQQAEDRLHEVGITVNRNAVPFDPRPPMVTSGLRIGTPALATRGLQVGRLRRGRQDHRPRPAAGLRGREARADRARDRDRRPLPALHPPGDTSRRLRKPFRVR